MKQKQLAKTLARQENVSGAAARDRIDEIVHKILKQLRTGQSVKLAGLGRLIAKPPSRRTPR